VVAKVKGKGKLVEKRGRTVESAIRRLRVWNEE